MNLHPAATLIPEMTPQEFTALKADIQAHGQREPIVILGETILDGRHRYRAVDELGYEPVFRDYRGDTDDASLIAFVLSQNLHRRHLTESQRAMIAARIASLKHGDNRFTIDTDKSVSTTQAARLLHVSEDSVLNARKVLRTGAKPLQRAVETGKVAVTTAAALAAAPKREQQHIVALNDEKAIIAIAKELTERNRAARREKKTNALRLAAANFELETPAPASSAPAARIIHADARDLLTYVAAESAQLVITSPPYNCGMEYDGISDNLPWDEYRELLAAVFARCYTALCDGGRIAVVVPFGMGRSPYVPLAPRVADILTECGFSYRGNIVWDKGTVQNRTSWGSHRAFTSPALRDRCESIIVMHKGSDTLAAPDGTLLEDAKGKFSAFLRDPNYFAELTQNQWDLQPETRLNGQHPAPFPHLLAQRLMHLYAYPGALVVDPFAGSGSTGIAAKQNGLRAILVEQSKLYCALARQRIAEAD